MASQPQPQPKCTCISCPSKNPSRLYRVPADKLKTLQGKLRGDLICLWCWGILIKGQPLQKAEFDINSPESRKKYGLPALDGNPFDLLPKETKSDAPPLRDRKTIIELANTEATALNLPGLLKTVEGLKPGDEDFYSLQRFMAQCRIASQDRDSIVHEIDNEVKHDDNLVRNLQSAAAVKKHFDDDALFMDDKTASALSTRIRREDAEAKGDEQAEKALPGFLDKGHRLLEKLKVAKSCNVEKTAKFLHDRCYNMGPKGYSRWIDTIEENLRPSAPAGSKMILDPVLRCLSEDEIKAGHKRLVAKWQEMRGEEAKLPPPRPEEVELDRGGWTATSLDGRSLDLKEIKWRQTYRFQRVGGSESVTGFVLSIERKDPRDFRLDGEPSLRIQITVTP